MRRLLRPAPVRPDAVRAAVAEALRDRALRGWSLTDAHG